MNENITDLCQRFKVPQGELDAGNNNPDINTEIKALLKKLVYYGKVTKEMAKEILEELDEE